MVKQILVELDEVLAKRLDEIAPSRKRQRSEFVRMAIVKAIMAEEEKRTRDAYRRHPDDPKDAYFDPNVWDPNAWRARDRKGVPARRRKR